MRTYAGTCGQNTSTIKNLHFRIETIENVYLWMKPGYLSPQCRCTSMMFTIWHQY